jgi:hypothetical protein
MSAPDSVQDRADRYFRRHGISGVEFDSGTQGHVWRTSRRSVVKVHIHAESYPPEVEAYTRLRALQLRSIEGFTIPRMYYHDDELLAIEMQIVFPPYIVDFASAGFDARPDLIEDEGHTFHDRIRDRFGEEDAPKVIDICDGLAARAGIYLLDPHPGNIKFRPDALSSDASVS